MTEKNRTTFYLARHGETEWNLQHKMQGRLDSRLTKRGESQASDLGKHFESRGVKFDRVLSSKSPRAVATARLIISDLPLEIVMVPEFQERNYGPYEGESTKKYLAEQGERLAKIKTLSGQERRLFRIAPGIENGRELLDRSIPRLEEEVRLFAGKTILVVSHGSILREIVAYIDENLTRIIIRNGGYMKAVHDGGNFRIEEMMGVEDAKE